MHALRSEGQPVALSGEGEPAVLRVADLHLAGDGGVGVHRTVRADAHLVADEATGGDEAAVAQMELVPETVAPSAT